MKTYLLVTATGKDRPGIVARLSEVFLAHDGNLEDSRMAVLAGEFAVIALVAVPEEKVKALQEDLSKLSSEAIAVSTKPAAPAAGDRFKGCLPCELRLSGADHEGIVHKVSKFLRDQAINIQSMESEVIGAPITGTPLFCMRALIQVPTGISLSALKQKLSAIGDEESVEIEVRVKATTQ